MIPETHTIEGRFVEAFQTGTRKYRLLIIALVTVVAGLVVAFVASSGDTQPRIEPGATSGANGQGAAFWSAVGYVGPDRLFAPTLTELVSESDAAVLGTFEDLRPNRVVEDAVAKDQLLFAVADLRVEQVLAGRLSPETGTVGVEFTVLGPSSEDARRKLREGADGLPRGRVVAFLISVDREIERLAAEGHNPGRVPEQQGLYILHSSYGIFGTTSRADLDTPLSDVPPASARHPYAPEMASLVSIEQLASRVQELAG